MTEAEQFKMADKSRGRERSVVLLSGGIDSATVLAMESAAGAGVTCLIVSYGQRHRMELRAAKRMAERFGANYRLAELPLTWLCRHPLTSLSNELSCRTLEEIRNLPSPAYIPARNTMLLSMALALAESIGANKILLGSNRDDWPGFPDCRPEYVIAWNGLGRTATQAKITIEAPLLTWPKSQVIQAAVGLYKIPIQETLSCYQPPQDYAEDDFLHCGACDACILRRDATAKAAENLPGWTDPTRYVADL